MSDFKIENAAQGIKGCEVVLPFDPTRAFWALKEWTELILSALEAAEKERDEAKARIGVPPWACANCDFTLNWGPDCATCGTLRGNADGKSTEDDQVRDLSVEASWRADLWEQEKKRANAAEAERDRLAAALEPFGEPRNWHHNYDRPGVIFQIDGDYTTKKSEQAIDAAAEALNPGDPGA